LMELRRRGVRSLEHTYQALLETVVPHLEWVDPWDHPPLTRSDDPREAFQGEVYRAFVGDDPEWVVAGTLARFDPTPALRDVAVPTVVITGRHDRVTTPSVAHAIADAFPNGRSRLVVFERSAHRPWIEETERYFAVVESLLAGRDARSGQTGQEQGGDR
ncbi:MAG TPA: alpha/beta hydrolase, partial [Gaiellaceae bacterium]|nr:alpha/beta hydrolase [Gaiellaceae bacterium]